MKQKHTKFAKFMLYDSLTADEFRLIRPLVWQRNRRVLLITSVLSAVMGIIFLAYALVTHTGMWPPYLILLIGSLMIYLINRLTAKSESVTLAVFLCYAQMLLVSLYAGILSAQPSNAAVPATSIIVFIAIMPLSIDDRLLRTFCIMISEAAVYLLASWWIKYPAAPNAFYLDMMNMITFCVIGMILYAVICIRNIREIYQGVRIERIQRETITSLATMVEERDEETGGHIQRTENYVEALIAAMKQDEAYAHISEKYYSNILLAAPMHDIGKIKIPDAILNKPGKLAADEYEIMKKHAEYGAEIIQKTMRDVEEEDYYDVACNIAKYHHERYDGGGYPSGLKGEDIPLEARIMALADVYDALISRRVYKAAFSKEESCRIIEENIGTQFDPNLGRLFLKCVE